MIGNLASNVGKELQDQIAPCVGGDRRQESKADYPGGNAGFGIVGHYQGSGGRTAGNSGIIELIRRRRPRGESMPGVAESRLRRTKLPWAIR